MKNYFIAAAVLLGNQVAWASEYRIVRIEPAGRVIIYVVEPDSKRRFQAAVGTVVGPSETIALGAPIARVDVINVQTGQRLQISEDRPMRVPSAGVWERLQTRLADIGRLSANMGATQSSTVCAARPGFPIPDIPILSGEMAMMAREPLRLVLPLRLRAGEVARLDLVDPTGRVVITADVRQPWWQGPKANDLAAGKYRVRLTSAADTTTERSLLLADQGPPASPVGAAAGSAVQELEAVRLATMENGRWRVQALAAALAIPKAARSERLSQLIELLGQGVRLHDPVAVAACLDP